MEQDKEKKDQKDDSAVEAHVLHLFAFTLGMVAGVNARRYEGEGKTFVLDDLPQGYSFAGGNVDHVAGDAAIEANKRWFLIEAKRTASELADDAGKPRIKNLKEKIRYEEELRSIAMKGHYFLYAGMKGDSSVNTPFLAVTSYLEWLDDEGKPDRLQRARERAESFIDFLLTISSTSNTGFLRQELEQYVQLMNDNRRVGGDGNNSKDGHEARIQFAIGVTATGKFSLHHFNELVQKLNLKVNATRESRQEKTLEVGRVSIKRKP